MLVWCLKQVKDFTFKFSKSGNFFSEKQFLNLYTIILASFLSGGCIDEVSDNGAIYQEYEYDIYFLQRHTLTVTHVMNGKRVCNVIRRFTFNVYICFNHSL